MKVSNPREFSLIECCYWCKRKSRISVNDFHGCIKGISDDDEYVVDCPYCGKEIIVSSYAFPADVRFFLNDELKKRDRYHFNTLK